MIKLSINQEKMKELGQRTDLLIKHSPAMQGKLHKLGFDNPEFVEQKLKEMEKRCSNEQI